MPTLHKTIDWEHILESYGAETKIGLHRLLSENGVSESDPAALVIAALFISQIDTNKAFQSISSTIDAGKAELSEEFKTQIVQLRGIISYAKEHLVETSKVEVEKRQDELLNVVKAGVSQAVGRHQRNSGTRSTAATVATIVCVATVSLVSVIAGGLGMYLTSAGSRGQVAPTVSAEWEAIPHADTWLGIAKTNGDKLDVCLENQLKLEGKCVIELPL